MTTFKQINRHEFLKRHMINDDDTVIQSLKHLTTLNLGTIKNIVTYANCLQKRDKRVITIDEAVFKAQMVDRFNLRHEHVVTRIFQAACNSRLQPPFKPRTSRGALPKPKKTSTLSLHNYCYLICIFLSGEKETKYDFVFDVFDEHRIDEISIGSLARLVQQSVDFVWGNNNNDEDKMDVRDEYIRDLMDMLLQKFDTNGDGSIDRSEFQQVMKTDDFMIDCLGQVFPDKNAVENFKTLIVGKTPLEVRAFFRFERRRSMQSIDLHATMFDDLYPIELEPWL